MEFWLFSHSNLGFYLKIYNFKFKITEMGLTFPKKSAILYL